MGFVLRLLVSVYRCFLSGIFGGVCRFQPTCSEYAEECLRELRPQTALKLIFKRIIKCHPWGPFGLDPVPITGEHRHE